MILFYTLLGSLNHLLILANKEESRELFGGLDSAFLFSYAIAMLFRFIFTHFLLLALFFFKPKSLQQYKDWENCNFMPFDRPVVNFAFEAPAIENITI